MLRYALKRLLSAIPIFLGVSIIVFAALYILPGDAVELMMQESAISLEQLEAVREELGLNDPFYMQYWRFLSGALQGDLGRSILSNRPVSEQIITMVPATLELTAMGLLVAVVLGVGLGILSAVKHNTWVDSGSMAFALVSISMPNFWLGIMAIYIFSLQLGWFPAAGTGGLEYLILPGIITGLRSAATIARTTRSSMLDVLRQDYLVTARSKGLRERTVIFGHALRNALVPISTVIGLQFGYLLGGAVVTETVFSRQGIGSLTVNAILKKDFPLVQGTVLFTACAYVFVNILVDISYGLIDPRIQQS